MRFDHAAMGFSRARACQVPVAACAEGKAPAAHLFETEEGKPARRSTSVPARSVPCGHRGYCRPSNCGGLATVLRGRVGGSRPCACSRTRPAARVSVGVGARDRRVDVRPVEREPRGGARHAACAPCARRSRDPPPRPLRAQELLFPGAGTALGRALRRARARQSKIHVLRSLQSATSFVGGHAQRSRLSEIRTQCGGR